MKKMMALLLISYAFLGMELPSVVVQIGEGNLDNQCLPVEPLVGYSYSQSIYLENELQLNGIITAVGFQYRINSSIFLPYTNDFSLYLGIVDRDRFHSLTDWVPLDSLTLLFQGELQPEWFYPGLPGEGWLTIPLTVQPFVYLGGGNLIVAIDENRAGGSSTGDDFYCTSCLYPQSLEIHSSSANPDPASPPPGYNNNPYNPLAVRPNLQLTFGGGDFAPHQPLPADNAMDVSLAPVLSWQSACHTWDVWFAPANQPLQLVAENLDSLSWAVPNSLSLYTQYRWQAVGHFLMTDHEGPVWTFRTMGETLTAPQNLTAMSVGLQVQLNWDPPAQGSIVSYNILRNQQLIDYCIGTQYLDSTVLPGQTYWYQVEAVNYLNQVSPPSNSVPVTVPGSLPVWQAGFDEQPDFVSSLPGWIMLDLDNSNTWMWDGIAFPGEGSPRSWLVFNPGQTTPPLTGLPAHSGSKFLLCPDSTNPPNNDWLISPRLSIQNGYELSFWARSVTADYGLERLRFLISASDTLTASFQPLSTEPWLNVPAAWTQIVYDLSPYAGQQVYLAWHCVSWDAFALCLDDIAITQSVGNQDENVPAPPRIRVYPNPARDWFNVESDGKTNFDFGLYNLKGQKIKEQKGIRSFSWKQGDGPELAPGMYILKIRINDITETAKLLLF